MNVCMYLWDQIEKRTNEGVAGWSYIDDMDDVIKQLIKTWI